MQRRSFLGLLGLGALAPGLAQARPTIKDKAALNKSFGSMSNVATPTHVRDVVCKAYVDAQVQGLHWHAAPPVQPQHGDCHTDTQGRTWVHTGTKYAQLTV